MAASENRLAITEGGNWLSVPFSVSWWDGRYSARVRVFGQEVEGRSWESETDAVADALDAAAIMLGRWADVARESLTAQGLVD